MARKIVIAITAGVLALSTTACNTVRGIAADLDSAADAVDDET
ncbi:hypothetical protein [Aurantiacibacter sp. D1-12]|nr:hypothetical protein [Aurantiacibacter sp. D1-12]MDE1466333.1 hypothetical protein [Aurantiacibacter sp. D1-12]